MTTGDVQPNCHTSPEFKYASFINHNKLGGMGLKGLWLFHGLVFGSFVNEQDSCFQLPHSFVKGEASAGERLEEMRVGWLAQFIITSSYTGFTQPVDNEILGDFKGINKKIQSPKVRDFTSIFFRTSYFISQSTCREMFS